MSAAGGILPGLVWWIWYGDVSMSISSHNGREGQCKVDMNGELLAFAFIACGIWEWGLWVVGV
jgi:hypothetical protein